MTRSAIKTVTLIGAIVALSAVGCCKEQEQQILELKRSNQQFVSDNEVLRGDLAQCQATNQQLQSQLAGVSGTIMQKDDEIAALKLQLAQRTTPPPPPVGPSAEGWTRTAAGDRISVGSDVLFSAGSATLTADGSRSLDKIVTDIKTTYAGLPVRVYGYTDSDPIVRTKNLWTDNLDLSANRAMAVTRYLQGKGVPAERIETIAMGETHPVASNDTKAGKQQNRRVEIVVVRK